MEQNFKLLNVSLSQESFQIKSILEIVLITLRQIFQKKKKFLYYIIRTHKFSFKSEFSILNKFPWRHCSNTLASHRVRM